MGPIKPIHGVVSVEFGKTVLIFARFNIKTDDRNSVEISNSINPSVAKVSATYRFCIDGVYVQYQASDLTGTDQHDQRPATACTVLVSRIDQVSKAC